MTDQPPLISIVVPVKNEADNLKTLITEIEQSCAKIGAFEIIYVDDGSTDGTSEMLIKLSQEKSHLRVLRHRISCGQSGAIRTGVNAASASIIATLDGDGQNNPIYLPEMYNIITHGQGQVGLVAGQRVGRKDGPFKKYQSKIANAVRGAMLKDNTRDSGCGLKCFPRDVYLRLPYFDALHRFMPALISREKLEIRHIDVVDRHRASGQSNYGFFDRLWVGILDLIGVWWLIRRRKRIAQVSELTEHKS